MLNENNLYLDINTIVFNYQKITVADFYLFIDKNGINSKNNLLILFFLILKNNSIFWETVNSGLQFTISEKEYALQLQLLKLFQNLYKNFSDNFEESLTLSKLDLDNSIIRQMFFDLSMLTNLDKPLLINNRIKVNNIMIASLPVEKYNLLESYLTKKQQKQLFLSCVTNFRTSSIVILNRLFEKNHKLFFKSILLKYINIFSQCDTSIQNIVFKFLLESNINKAFKLGTQLSYTHFPNNSLKEFFDQLYNKNPEIYFLFASGFITNPQQLNVEIIDYLIKKNNFIRLNNRLLTKNNTLDKVVKI